MHNKYKSFEPEPEPDSAGESSDDILDNSIATTRKLPSQGDAISVSPSYLHYYTAILQFKKRFVKNLESQCDKRREIYKIWAHWLIRILSRRPNNFHPLVKIPTDLEDEHILKHMEQNRVALSKALVIYKELIDQYNILHAIYASEHEKLFSDPILLSELQGKINLTYFTGNSIYILGLQGTTLSIKLTPDKFFKLKKNYTGPKEFFLVYLFEYSFNYYLLDGKSLQWSIPVEIFENLKKFNLRGELFASPVNHYCPHFYSLFEIDKLFGSMGNLFAEKELPEGLYEVNPPFIEEIFTESSKLIVKLLEESESPLGFVYVMPAWVDLEGYNYLTRSKFFVESEILDRNKHFYFQCSNNKYILASFDTNILVVANESFKRKYSITQMLSGIKEGFSKGC